MSEVRETPSRGEQEIKDKAIKKHLEIAGSPLPERIRIRSRHAAGKLIKDTKWVERIAKEVQRSPRNLNPPEVISEK